MNPRDKWEQKYGFDELIYGETPSTFLKENAALLPKGGISLDVAAGEGRNSIFLAERGFKVVAVDISTNGLIKCRNRSQSLDLTIDTLVADVTQMALPAAYFDLVICFNFLERLIIPKMMECLRPDGVLVYETFSLEYLKVNPSFNPNFVLQPGELLHLFSALHLVKYRETSLQRDQKKPPVASIIVTRSQ